MDNKIIYGINSVISCFTGGEKQEIIEIYVIDKKPNKRLQFVLNLANESKINVVKKTKEELDKLSLYGKHQGIISVVSVDHCTDKIKKINSINDFTVNKNTLCLILDGIQDPHNLGACLRSASAFGVDLVILPKDRSVGLTPVVSKVACGGAESVSILIVTNLSRTIEELKQKGVWIVGTAIDNKSKAIFDLDLTGPIALIVGSEGAGIRDLTKSNCDYLVQIPMQADIMQSLNVSVATGISLFEVSRQRQSFVN